MKFDRWEKTKCYPEKSVGISENLTQTKLFDFALVEVVQPNKVKI